MPFHNKEDVFLKMKCPLFIGYAQVYSQALGLFLLMHSEKYWKRFPTCVICPMWYASQHLGVYSGQDFDI